MDVAAIAQYNLILKTMTGSRLYGTERADSDVDYVGVFIPPKIFLYGLHECDQAILNEHGPDGVIDYTCYTLHKYIRLAIANNPNILSMLYTPPKQIIECDQWGQRS